jgi:hypothetical protein
VPSPGDLCVRPLPRIPGHSFPFISNTVLVAICWIHWGCEGPYIYRDWDRWNEGAAEPPTASRGGGSTIVCRREGLCALCEPDSNASFREVIQANNCSCYCTG